MLYRKMTKQDWLFGWDYCILQILHCLYNILYFIPTTKEDDNMYSLS